MGKVIPHRKLAAYRYLETLLLKWAPVFNKREWVSKVTLGTGEKWSFQTMLEYLRRRYVDKAPEPKTGSSSYFEFLMELEARMLLIPPGSRRGRQLALFCEDLARAPIHEVSELFATVVLENLFRFPAGRRWRRFFYEAWQGNPLSQVRAVLAFATCFTDFPHKKKLLLLLASDKDPFVRQCVLQSLWYRKKPYPGSQKPTLKKIILLARKNAGKLASKFARDITRINFPRK